MLYNVLPKSFVRYLKIMIVAIIYEEGDLSTQYKPKIGHSILNHNSMEKETYFVICLNALS